MWDNNAPDIIANSNYAEEASLLFRSLRTPTFRFVLVHFNHYAFVAKLRDDLAAHYPERTMAEIDAADTTYRSFMDAYAALGSGLLLVHNFDSVLKSPELYTGLNLRRDRLAEQAVAMICFIAPGADALYARTMMKLMPDLWSFRSVMLDLKTDFVAEGITTSSNKTMEPSSLDGVSRVEKLLEMERLQVRLMNTPATETALQVALLEQIVTLQSETGAYEAALESIEQLLLHTGADPVWQFYFMIEKGDMLNNLHLYEEAIETYSFAAAFASQSFAAAPQEEQLKSSLAVSYSRLGNIHQSLGSAKEAMEFFEKGREFWEELHDFNPHSENFKNRLAISYGKLGELYQSLGDVNRARDFFEKTKALFEELYESSPRNESLKSGLAVSYGKLGDLYQSLSDTDKALNYFQKTKDIFEELYKYNPSSKSLKNGLATSYSKLGGFYLRLGNTGKALEYFEQQTKLFEELCASNPHSESLKSGLSISYEKLGGLYKSLGDTGKALEYFEQEIKLFEELYASNPRSVGITYGLFVAYWCVADIYELNKDYKTALAYFHLALPLIENLSTGTPIPKYKEWHERLLKEITRIETFL